MVGVLRLTVLVDDSRHDVGSHDYAVVGDGSYDEGHAQHGGSVVELTDGRVADVGVLVVDRRCRRYE